MSKTYQTAVGGLNASFAVTGEGLFLAGLTDGKSSRAYLRAPQPLFTLEYECLESGARETVSSADGWTVAVVDADADARQFTLSGCAKLPGVIVTLTVRGGGARITFEMNLSSANAAVSLTACDWPNLCFDAAASRVFFNPYGPGEVWPSDKEGGFSSTQNYPSYGASMQYLAFWDEDVRRGVYYGLHDGAPASKFIHFSRSADGVVTLKIAQPLENIADGCNSQKLYGVCVWQPFDGDWYDAAMLYRTWALSEASWLPEIDENGRKDLPLWFKANPHWWWTRMEDDRWWTRENRDETVADEVVRATAELGSTSAVHLYDWHKIPFDNDYPHYFPVKDELADALKTLRAAGIKIMPYINGRLWDTKDRQNEDWQFSKIAYPNCTKDRHGKPFIETYSSKEIDGTKVELSIMCPSTAVWQEKQKEIVGKLFNELDMDAVYIDQIGAAKANPCADKNHPHPAGGGTWWVASYNNLLDHVRRTSDRAVLTTECTSDPFMKHIGGYLSWLWVRNGQVPAFTAIYNEYVVTFGIHYVSMTGMDSTCFRIFFAQSLVYGEQMGWMRPDTFLRMQEADKAFYRRLVKTRETLAEYFYGGRMLRPPYLTDDAPRLRSEKSTQAIGGLVDYPAVQGGLWERMGSGRKLLLLVNAAESETNVELQAELPDGAYALQGDLDGTLTFSGGKASLKMPASSVTHLFCD